MASTTAGRCDDAESVGSDRRFEFGADTEFRLQQIRVAQAPPFTPALGVARGRGHRHSEGRDAGQESRSPGTQEARKGMEDLVIRVLLVDDHAFVREAVSLLLHHTGGFEVVGQADDGAAALALACSTEPDVVLMDIRMPGIGGLQATRILMADRPSLRVLILAAAVSVAVLEDARRAGARGYVLKGGAPDVLVRGIRAIAAGGTLW
ncbi:CheY-like chemotaxis protein [Nakamurella sp. UYEF19]|uniref:response regulator n=1 Tax=Nakamurella sp. UYEF19 TaxID=1756392 RepID=UPI0033945946